MKRLRGARPLAERHADVIAVGAPALAVAKEDREQLEDLVAEMLLSKLAHDEEAAR